VTRLGVIFTADRPSEALPAMEIATLARLHPGRSVAGIGHGVPGWMEQIGALPDKPVRALEETARGIRRLLAGERVSTTGDPGRLRARLHEKLYRALRPGVFVLGAHATPRHR
jgi:5,10-methylenetetrahydromethanopterin reductase